MKNVMLASYANQFFELAYNFRDGESTLKDFINAIERQVLTLDNRDEEQCNKFKGDCLEIFAEIFFKAFENDPSIGLKDYSPINIENDYGVDAIGINANNQRVAVQVKYRGNPCDLVLYEEIAKTYTSGTLMLDLDLNERNSIYVFTTAIDITPSCKKVFGNRIVVLNIDIIGDYVRNNKSFWEFLYQEVYAYLNN